MNSLRDIRPGDGHLERLHPVLAVLLVAAGLRLYAIGRESLWMDELYSVGDALRFSTVELLTVLPVVKNHAPAYYVLLRHWIPVVGLSEAALRLPSALAGVVTVYVLFRVGERLFDRRTGLLAAAMLALSAFHVAHGQEVRMYALVALLAVVSWYSLVALEDGGTRSAVGYVLATALLVYTHPYGVFLILAQNGYVWSRLAAGGGPTVDLRRWLSVQTGLGAVLSPYGVVLLGKLRSTAGGSYTPLYWRTPPGPVDLAGTPLQYLGLPAHPAAVAVGLPLLAALVGVAVFAQPNVGAGGPRTRLSAGRDDREALLLAGWWLTVPVLAPAVLSHVLAPIYGVRYTIGASPALFLLLASGASKVRPRHIRAGVVAVLLVALVAPLPAYYAQPQHEQWRQATTGVAASAETGDLVVFTDNGTETAWTVYGSGSDLAVRTASDDGGWAALRGELRTHETVWVLNRTHPTTNENRPAAAVLSDTHRLAAERTYHGVEVYRFERRTASDGSNRSRNHVDDRATVTHDA